MEDTRPNIHYEYGEDGTIKEATKIEYPTGYDQQTHQHPMMEDIIKVSEQPASVAKYVLMIAQAMHNGQTAHDLATYFMEERASAVREFAVTVQEYIWDHAEPINAMFSGGKDKWLISKEDVNKIRQLREGITNG